VDFEADEGAPAVLVDNADWLGSITLVEFLRSVGKLFTVNQMVAKESVRSRFERADQGISYTEFSYMLLQAYDFLRLYEEFKCELQIGGSDQWGNITTGVELVRKVHAHEVYGLTSPLVTKPDGTKYGKSASGTVWLDPHLTSPYQLYQFFLQTDDAVVRAYLRYFTFLSHDQLEELDHATMSAPERRAAQRALAREVVTLVHGAEEAQRAAQASEALFVDGFGRLDPAALDEVLADAPSSPLDRSLLSGEGWSVVDALSTCALARSKGDARRLIEGGGVYVNDQRVRELDAVLTVADLLGDRYIVLRRGARNRHVLVAG
jgi:tyrosyl-tRNA synthetase